jgi:transcriptional regulator with XRE-family HTH domain
MAKDTPGARIGRRLRELREERLLSRNVLAERSGVSLAGIEHLEYGRRVHPRRTTIEKLARVLGVSVEEIIGLPRPLELSFTTMSRATEDQRRRALAVATDDQMRAYVLSIDRAIDSAEGWRAVEQDQEALDAYIAFLHALRVETDPFDVVPPTPDQRARLVATHASGSA